MKRLITITLFLLHLESRAVEFEKVGSSIAAALGTKQAFKTTVNLDDGEQPVFYAKDRNGKPSRYAVVRKATYEPNCAHTWVIGITGDLSVDSVRVVEMSCPHSFPGRKESFLAQFRGKGPADMKTLKEKVHTIAKATGTSKLTADAVVAAVQAAGRAKGGF